jgi:undecaprenyl-diphosphatase
MNLMVAVGPTWWQNSFDFRTEQWLNHFVGHHPWFDKIMLVCDGSNLPSSVVIVFLIWLAVFDARRPGQLRARHELIFASTFFAMLATLAARVLAISLPFRARPIATPSLAFVVPSNDTLVLIHWSSFPSDHATLFFALAVGLLFVSRPLGYIALLWTTFMICLPRLYLGEHWLTDIVVGAIIGICCVQLARIPAVSAFTRRQVERFHDSRPALFFAALFLWSYEGSILFEDIRRVLFLAHKVF